MVVRFAADVAAVFVEGREADVATENREDCAKPKWDEAGEKGVHIETPQR